MFINYSNTNIRSDIRYIELTIVLNPFMDSKLQYLYYIAMY